MSSLPPDASPSARAGTASLPVLPSDRSTPITLETPHSLSDSPLEMDEQMGQLSLGNGEESRGHHELGGLDRQLDAGEESEVDEPFPFTAAYDPRAPGSPSSSYKFPPPATAAPPNNSSASATSYTASLKCFREPSAPISVACSLFGDRLGSVQEEEEDGDHPYAGLYPTRDERKESDDNPFYYQPPPLAPVIPPLTPRSEGAISDLTIVNTPTQPTHIDRYPSISHRTPPRHLSMPTSERDDDELAHLRRRTLELASPFSENGSRFSFDQTGPPISPGRVDSVLTSLGIDVRHTSPIFLSPSFAFLPDCPACGVRLPKDDLGAWVEQHWECLKKITEVVAVAKETSR